MKLLNFILLISVLLSNAQLYATPEGLNQKLFDAIVERAGKEELDALLEQGADIDAYDDERGYAPLHESAWSDYSGLISGYLLSRGAELHVRDKQGNTALHIAALRGHGLGVYTLLQWYPEVNAQNNRDETALHLVCRHFESSSLAARYSVVIELLEYGADPSMRDKDGKTALEIAQEKKFDSAVKLMRSYTGIRGYLRKQLNIWQAVLDTMVLLEEESHER